MMKYFKKPYYTLKKSPLKYNTPLYKFNKNTMISHNQEALDRMKQYNEEKQFEKTIELYQNLYFIERLDPKIKFHYNQAGKQVQQIDKLILKILGQRRRMSFFSYVILFVFSYYAYKFLDNKYPNTLPKFSESDDKDKKSKSGTKSNNGLFKMFDGDMNFDVSFATDMKERLGDVKGIEEVRDEIEQLIRMIKDPQKYRAAGAKLHKGILLCGKPGTGKTLIARAVAGEANVNFLFLTGSDFDEMFVGVGAARIRKLFKKARENSPCIIFIDEIDSLLTKSRRSSHEHSSSRSTVNQFLGEMDGFDKMENVFLIGATNHQDDLDPAAIRPGRFDKTIHINVPDEDGRLDIINFYIQRIVLEKTKLDAKFIARMTPGFTGAEIENLINLSIIHAVNQDKKEIDMEDIGEARDRVLMGISRKNYTATDKSRFHTSVHESGHTLICYLSKSCKKKLDKVTIIPRGPAAGVTFMLTDEEALHSKEEFISEIDVAMGGHVAEELMNGPDNITAGCSSDLNKATSIAQEMVKKWGMYGKEVGYIYVEDGGYSWEEDKVSEKYKSNIDQTVKLILKESHDRVYETLKTHANDLKNLSQNVFKYDTLYMDEIEAVMQGRLVDIKKDIVRSEYVEKNQNEESDNNLEKKI